MFSFLSTFFSSSHIKKDVSFGLLQQHGIDTLIKKSQWDQIEDLATTLSSDELSRLLDGMCLTNRYDRELKQYVAAIDSEFGYLVAGAWYLHMAWQARTRKLGKDLSKSEIRGFKEYLDAAEQHLNMHFVSDIFRSEAQARMVRVWMGMSEGDRAIDSFKRSISASKTNFLAYHHLFKTLSPKWLGDKEELKGFINSVQVPAIQYALWTMYLVEIYSDDYFENSQTARKKWYEENRNLIIKIINHTPLPVNSSLPSIYANNNLVYLYHLLGDEKKRNQLFDQLDGQMTPYPWDYFGVESYFDKKNFRYSSACSRL